MSGIIYDKFKRERTNFLVRMQSSVHTTALPRYGCLLVEPTVYVREV
jgi:hypothetical protein